MGTGKSAVGRDVAQRLGHPFVDMDAEIEARASKPIPRIFAEDGEAVFRQMEATLCEELSAQEGLVIATGGGALVNPNSRARMLASSTVICLSCTPEEILRRVGANGDRPRLDVADPRAEVERLLEARRESYAAISWQIETTDLSVGEIAEQVIELADTITQSVHYRGGAYDVHVGNGLLVHIGGALRAAGVPEGTQVAVVSNPVVTPLYGAQVEESLLAAGFEPFPCSVPDGEQHKTLATVATLYDQFLAGGLDRSGVVLALGGGVTGDIAGFAAASFMRGTRFAQVPTTLLAMTDASVGGKTGVDLPQGKNLVGAFKQPVMVLIDPLVLEALDSAEVRSGMAEVIKHAIIGDRTLFAELEASPQSPISVPQLARSLRVKIEIVEQDPFETGRRAVLNLGHTVGHGLERLSDYAMRHGEAISIGMVAAARIAVEQGLAEQALVDRVEAVLAAWELPVRCPPFDADAISAAMAHDKKRRGHALRWVLPHAIGEVDVVEKVPPEVTKQVLRGLGAR
jgi:3-dehydroquinate synthase